MSNFIINSIDNSLLMLLKCEKLDRIWQLSNSISSALVDALKRGRDSKNELSSGIMRDLSALGPRRDGRTLLDFFPLLELIMHSEIGSHKKLRKIAEINSLSRTTQFKKIPKNKHKTFFSFKRIFPC